MLLHRSRGSSTHQPLRTQLYAWRVLISVALAIVGVMSGTLSAAAYVQTVTPWYTHSWYIGTTDVGHFQALGASDGDWDSAHCYGPGDNHSLNKIAVLDFGRPINVTGSASPYYGYGTVLPGGTAPSVRYDTTVYLTEQYALYYFYHSQASCQQLLIAMGQNNSYMCQRGAYPCDNYTAGQTWGDAVNQVNIWLVNNGLSSRISALAANDMETFGDVWACAGPTRNWIDGYVANNYGNPVFNYGDAITSAGCWSIQDVYYVSAGKVYTAPLAEQYTAGGNCYWTTGTGQVCIADDGLEDQGRDYSRGFGVEGSNAPMTFAGEMTECKDADPIPYGPCSVINHHELGPGQAWQELWDLQQTLYASSQTTMDYSTNINFQPL